MEPRISIITLGVQSLTESYNFYHHGLGFETSGTPKDGILFFKTTGCCLALYPYQQLAEDALLEASTKPSFSGITLAHNTHSEEQVEQILKQAELAGAKIIKPAQTTSWGGYHGYFTDLDGYLWEIAYGAMWQFNPDGSLLIK
ncbi:VOC family protein [Entomomonas sp. E2T0]|uniref:VOC family protein n=1 Tax=Entomomonas sp. E2T0 TaxID=2930213 RepID=UPI00222827B2|nr:VOC family protein [Entomomonas sp. E2T0]UYZ84820.1 VOC family protein [Entomomonas sp. E2T0]